VRENVKLSNGAKKTSLKITTKWREEGFKEATRKSEMVKSECNSHLFTHPRMIRVNMVEEGEMCE
jgi:hypothetical protein